MLKAIIPAADYLYLCRFTSQEETRYYLKGVFVSTTRQHLVSTDGHRLGLIRPEDNQWQVDPSEENASFILTNSKDLQRACKASRYECVWLRCFDDRVEIVKVSASAATAEDIAAFTGPVSVTFPASAAYVDGTFPDYERVIPSECDGVTDGLGFNAKYLADFTTPDSKSAAVQVFWAGSGVNLVVNGDSRFLGVLMGTRAGKQADIIDRRNAILAPPAAAVEAVATEDAIAA